MQLININLFFVQDAGVYIVHFDNSHSQPLEISMNTHYLLNTHILNAIDKFKLVFFVHSFKIFPDEHSRGGDGKAPLDGGGGGGVANYYFFTYFIPLSPLSPLFSLFSKAYTPFI